MTVPSDLTASLIAAATVGTAHRAVDLAALPEPIRPDPLPADPAAGLLAAAALSVLARRTVPATLRAAASAPKVPTPERLPMIPTVVRQVLSRVANQPAILLEALSLIQRAGLRLPPEMVPGMLDDARPEVVAAVRPVTGEIGRLLMAKNIRWAPKTELDTADRSVWDEGITAERVAWLRKLREVAPATARDLLVASISREGASSRTDLLAVLAVGLSAADQDFLLSALGDRSRAVAATAITLLTQLPDSPLRRDMRTIAARHLIIGRRLLRTTVTITQPRADEYVQWPLPDGDPWTVVLGLIDPADWPQLFGGDLGKLIAAGAEDLHPLLPGFRQSAITFAHAGLAAVLVAAALARGDRKAPPIVDAALWSVLTPADATVLLDRLLSYPSVRPEQVSTVATSLSRPWPNALASRFARWLPTGGHSGAPASRQLWDLLASAAALPDCRELADLARSLATGTTGDHAATLTTRASSSGNLLTLRAVLHETLVIPGGTT